MKNATQTQWPLKRPTKRRGKIRYRNSEAKPKAATATRRRATQQPTKRTDGSSPQWLLWIAQAIVHSHKDSIHQGAAANGGTANRMECEQALYTLDEVLHEWQ